MRLHYTGPGKKNTGDWCFPDGFIEFKDILKAYMECFHKKGKYLEIFSDCSYSGRWIIALQEFLDEVGVQPCGQANILLKMGTSCQSHEIPQTMLYSARAMRTCINTGELYNLRNGYKIEKDQLSLITNSMLITCLEDEGASFEDPSFMVSGGPPRSESARSHHARSYHDKQSIKERASYALSSMVYGASRDESARSQSESEFEESIKKGASFEDPTFSKTKSSRSYQDKSERGRIEDESEFNKEGASESPPGAIYQKREFEDPM